jgi:hypothetical protein
LLYLGLEGYSRFCTLRLSRDISSQYCSPAHKSITTSSTTRTAMFRSISRLSVGENNSIYQNICVCNSCPCSRQLAPVTRRSPPTTSYILRRLLSSEARAQIQKAIDGSPLVLFMKGTPELPQCGFSRAVIQVLDLHGVLPEKMKTYNVLEDPELRNGIKEFSWVYFS